MTVSQYTQILYRGRNIITSQMTQRLQRELVELYVQRINEAYNRLLSDEIDETTYIRWVRQFQDVMVGFSGEAELLAKREILRTIEQVGQLHSTALNRLLTTSGMTIGYSFEGIVDEALRGHFYRRELFVARTFKTLQKRNLVHIADRIEQDIARAINEGKSWKALRSDLVKTILLETNSPQELSQEIRSKRIISLRDFGSVSTDGRAALKKLFFDMDRIARTEINNANSEADRACAERSPVIKAIQWTLSGRHAGLPSSPDECDVYAAADEHGLGAGIYYAETLPARPHPFCLCPLLYVVRPMSEWGEPKPEPPEPKPITENEVQTILINASGDRIITKNEIKYITEHYNEKLLLANKVWQSG